MGPLFLILAALLSSTIAAPWRCYRTPSGDTVCFGRISDPCIKPAEICVNRFPLPCMDPAVVCTPPCQEIYPCNPYPCLPC